jgi:hypothetical protein
MARKLYSWALAAIGGLAIAGGSQAAEVPSFAGYVVQGYREIAFFALNQIGSPTIAEHFASRAQLADVQGVVVEPEAIGDWDVDRKLASEARPARKQLMDRLGNGAQWAAPLTSAIAVLNFDCWVGFASADPSSSAECRRRFVAALQTLPAHPSPAPAVPAGATTILIALQACAAPPWLGDCPMPGAPGRSSPASPAQRHAGGETTGHLAVSALAATDRPAAISALADVAPGPGGDVADAVLVPSAPATANLVEAAGPASAGAPAD